jgi:LysM repeat protein
MQISSYRGLCFASLTVGLLLLASCATRESTSLSPSAAVSPPVAMATLPKQSAKTAPGRSLTITVKPGQSLGGIAEHYHVPKRAIIAANQLQPPYELRAGSRLVIPGAAANTAVVEPRHRAVKSGSITTAHATKAKLPPASEPEVIPLD